MSGKLFNQSTFNFKNWPKSASKDLRGKKMATMYHNKVHLTFTSFLSSFSSSFLCFSSEWQASKVVTCAYHGTWHSIVTYISWEHGMNGRLPMNICIKWPKIHLRCTLEKFLVPHLKCWNFPEIFLSVLLTYLWNGKLGKKATGFPPSFLTSLAGKELLLWQRLTEQRFPARPSHKVPTPGLA